MESGIDIAIIGGGPAGATAARLLASWGFSTAIYVESERKPRLGECLPPSNRKIFQFLGIQDAIDGAGFFRTTGNTVWWGEAGRRVEPYVDGWGYQVNRSDFDRLLLDLAIEAGAQIHDERYVRANAGAKFVLDCTGRAGVVARRFRKQENRAKTIALCGIWLSERGWKLPDATHTLVEAYRDGWAWSVPVSRWARFVAFMVDPNESRPARSDGLTSAYLGEFAKTRAFRGIFSLGELARAPWGRDASPYCSSRYGGSGYLLVGDAGSFIDPLSSFGIKKAMASAWMAAVVAKTCIRDPSMQSTALEFFNEREREVYANYRKHSAAWFRASAGQGMFWAKRSEPEDAEEPQVKPDDARQALEALKASPTIHLRLVDGITIEKRAGIEGHDLVLHDALIGPGLAKPLDYIASVNLARLAEIAGHHSQVPELYEAYNRSNAPVPLPNFLTALATLVAKGILLIPGS